MPNTPIAWPYKGLRRASINSFGASGTNAHVVIDDVYHFLHARGLRGNHCTLEEPVLPESPSHKTNGHINASSPSLVRAESSTHRLLILSGSDEAAMERVTNLYDKWLKKAVRDPYISPKFLDNLAHTLNLRRTHLTYKSFAVLKSIEELNDLQSYMSAPIRAIEKPRIAFIFSGQGAQWAGMGRELLRYPIFRESLEQANAYLKGLGSSWNVIGRFPPFGNKRK